MCWVVIQLLLPSSDSFCALEPAVQAVVQATVKSVLQFPGVSMDMQAVLGLLESVPLLHAEDYEHAAKLPGTSKFCGCGLCPLLLCSHCLLLDRLGPSI